MQVSAVLALITMLAVVTAAAETRPSGPSSVGRWQMTTRQDGAIVRLDTATGEVSVCRAKPGGIACGAVTDDRAVLEREIDRLVDERAALLTRIDDLEARVAGLERGRRNGDSAAGSRRFERVLGFAEEAIRRLYGLVEDLRREWGDGTGSTDPPPRP